MALHAQSKRVVVRGVQSNTMAWGAVVALALLAAAASADRLRGPGDLGRLLSRANALASEVEVAGKSMNILQSLNVCLPSPHSIFPILSRFWDPAVVSQPRGMSRSRRNLVSRCSWCSHTAPSPSGSSEHPYPRAYSLTRQQLPHPGCWTSSIAKPKVVGGLHAQSSPRRAGRDRHSIGKALGAPRGACVTNRRDAAEACTIEKGGSLRIM